MDLVYFFKRIKVVYYLKNIALDTIPRFIFRNNLEYWINQQKKYPKEILDSRVEYYCKIKKSNPISDGFTLLKKMKLKGNKSMYYFDFMRIARYFNSNFKVHFLFGDVDKNVNFPTIVKSRPISNSDNSTLLKLDTLRHYNFIQDKKSFQSKKNAIVWRGVIHKENRILLFEKYFGNSKFDIGSSNLKNSKKEWLKPFLSIQKQLEYKFILSIEGIDVATNLKWIMSSNSLCFMPKPKFETWYMEGKLIPDYHYVLINDDYSDVEEKMEFYSKNSLEAEKIIANAKKWTKQFQDKKLEKIVSILVLKKYFENTNQI